VSVSVHDRRVQETFPCAGVLAPNVSVASDVEVEVPRVTEMDQSRYSSSEIELRASEC
jgi:hypothetical protein